jgi:beta-carotene 3-hydroxylase
MHWMLAVSIVLATFCLMEFMAWATHKYVMHGFLWVLHRDHHEPHNHIFERNDAFFLIFAVPSWLCIMFGMMAGNDFRLFIGIGIAVYGFAYFLVHEVFIHQRLPFFKRSDNWYLRAIRKAHKVHHKNHGKEDGESFGMLLVAMRYFKEQRSVSR